MKINKPDKLYGEMSYSERLKFTFMEDGSMISKFYKWLMKPKEKKKNGDK